MMLMSCQPSYHFEKKHRFENKNWVKFNDLKYEVPVEAGKRYSFSGNILFDSTYHQRKIEIGFYLYLPDDEERLSDYSFRVLDYDYLPIGEKTENGYSLALEFKKQLLLSESGLLTVQISHHSQYLDNFGIIGLDLFVEEE